MQTLIGTTSVAASIAATVHLLLRYRSPTAAVAWIFAVWFVPLLGALLYLMFAVYEGPRKTRRRKTLSRELRRSSDRASRSPGRSKDLPRSALDELAERAGALCMAAGNEVHLHATAEEARQDFMDLVRSAQFEVLIETYILTDDTFAEELCDLLTERASAGVRVRFLVDGVGTRLTSGSVIDRLSSSGMACARFLPPNPLKGRFQINFRNHRKLLVVDGKRAITGGRNCDERYFHEGKGGRRDLSVSIAGPAVAALRSVFTEDWLVATETEQLETLPIPEPVGTSHVRVIPHGCDEPTDSFVPILSAAIRGAQSDVLIVTPYFVPGDEILHDLYMTALSGVRVRILLPEHSPERLPEYAARYYFARLLAVGVEIYICPDPFLHAKAIVVDERWAVVGSANFDQRSFSLNYELSCEVADPDFAHEVAEYFVPDLQASDRVDLEEFEKRGWRRRALENAANLLAPIL